MFVKNRYRRFFVISHINYINGRLNSVNLVLLKFIIVFFGRQIAQKLYGRHELLKIIRFREVIFLSQSVQSNKHLLLVISDTTFLYILLLIIMVFSFFFIKQYILKVSPAFKKTAARTRRPLLYVSQ